MFLKDRPGGRKGSADLFVRNRVRHFVHVVGLAREMEGERFVRSAEHLEDGVGVMGLFHQRGDVRGDFLPALVSTFFVQPHVAPDGDFGARAIIGGMRGNGYGVLPGSERM